MIIIRELEEKDLDEVCQLEARVFSMPWKKQDFIDMIASEAALYMVAEDDQQPGKILGCCGVRNIVMEGDISNVVVQEAARNQGIGKKMLQELMLRSYEIWGMKVFTLEVRVGNQPAISLYKSLGFQSEGIRKNFYEKPKEDAMIMWKR